MIHSTTNDLLALATEPARTFESIPIIDITDLSNGTNPAQVANAIRDACVHVGFFYVKNHGIDDQIIENVVKVSKQFFDLPDEEKTKLDIHKSSNFKGYTALLGENTNPENRGDLHEGFDIGPESSTGDSANDSMSGSNVWPDSNLIPEFREAVMNYYQAIVSLGLKLFPAFALALNLPEDFFADKVQDAAAIMRLLHYPPQTGVVDDRVQGIGAHTEQCFTILWQDGVSALQVLNTTGQWVDAIPIPGTFVINIGDQLARWTNDVFKSTVHRAINRSGVRRYSMPLFFGTDYHVKLEALPSCVSETRPPRYEVVYAGDYVKSRLEETYAHSK
ncbi:Clavaminate synthase-like protein [Ceratobasidium sp. AG-I]|nr:Clavaminate synthase-like protein [Ceratobasidium sp. AG-I]